MYSVLRNNLHGKIIWERIYIYAYAKLFNVLEHVAYCVLLGVSGMFALSTESLLGLLVLSATPGWLWGVYIVLHTILAGFFFFFHFWWMGLFISGMKRKRWLSPSAVNTCFACCFCAADEHRMWTCCWTHLQHGRPSYNLLPQTITKTPNSSVWGSRY